MSKSLPKAQPHSKIISATKGFQEYRQIHLAAVNPGLWPATRGVETDIPVDRKIDGVAEVTFQSALSPLRGRKQTRLAFKDEVNIFRRTLLYLGPPNSSRWYDVAEPGEQVGARTPDLPQAAGRRTCQRFPEVHQRTHQRSRR